MLLAGQRSGDNSVLVMPEDTVPPLPFYTLRSVLYKTFGDLLPFKLPGGKVKGECVVVGGEGGREENAPVQLLHVNIYGRDGLNMTQTTVSIINMHVCTHLLGTQS